MSNNEELRCVISDLIEQNKAVTKQRDIAVAALKWIDDNTTFYDVKHPVDDAANVPTLASVSKRIWYHATDDQVSYPFSAIALSQIEGETNGTR